MMLWSPLHQQEQRLTQSLDHGMMRSLNWQMKYM